MHGQGPGLCGLLEPRWTGSTLSLPASRGDPAFGQAGHGRPARRGPRARQRFRRLSLATLAIGALLAACGGSSTPAPTSVPTAPAATTVAATPTPTGPAPSGAPAAASCPTAATVATALGVTLPEPVSVPGGGGTPLPVGATGVACEYHGATLNVIIELIANIDPSAIFELQRPLPGRLQAGVRRRRPGSFVPPGAERRQEQQGVVATKGRALVDVTATATPASLAQVEALVAQLL